MNLFSGSTAGITLEKIYKAHNIKGVRCKLVDVDINRVEIGSLNDWLNLAIEVTIVGEADAETKKKVLEDIKSMGTTAKIGVLFGALGILAIVRGCADSGKELTNIGGIQQSWAINIGTTFQLPPEKVTPILEKTEKSPSPSLIQGVLDFVSPARTHGGKIVIAK